MINKRALTPFIFSGLSVLCITSGYAANSYHCPLPQEVQSTNFSAPSIWIAPPIAGSSSDEVGIGLGGQQVGELIGTEPVDKEHPEKEWVCIYKSHGGLSIADYQAKIRQIVESTPYLRKKLDQINKEFYKAEPYMQKYPNDMVFVHYYAE